MHQDVKDNARKGQTDLKTSGFMSLTHVVTIPEKNNQESGGQTPTVSHTHRSSFCPIQF